MNVMLPAARRRISICLRGTQETLIYDDADIAEAFVYTTRRVHQLGVSLLSSHQALRQSLDGSFI